MKKLFPIALVSLAPLLAACSNASPTSPSAPAPTPLKTLRIELPTDVDISDVPRLMAADTLRDMGYQIEAMDFTDNNLSVQAVINGSSDIGHVGTGTQWAAVEKGAKLISIVDGSLNPAALIARGTIQKCEDLNGTRVAFPSLTSNRTLMANKYVALHCPNTKFEPMVIQTQSAMIAALEAGQIDAATTDYTSLLDLQSQKQTDLHELVHFADEFPAVTGAGAFTRRELAEKNPQAIKDFIRATLLARRKLQDPQAMADAFVKYIKMDPAQAKKEAGIFIKHRVWDLNGGYTDAGLQENLDFVVESGLIKPGLKVSDISDLSYLNVVLDEIGRK